MRGAMPPLPQYVFMAWCLVKHRDNFYLLPLRQFFKSQNKGTFKCLLPIATVLE
jgi:hypothetical protein